MQIYPKNFPDDQAVFTVKVIRDNVDKNMSDQLKDIIGQNCMDQVGYEVEAVCKPEMLPHLARAMIQFLAEGIPTEMLAFISVEIFKNLRVEREKDDDRTKEG